MSWSIADALADPHARHAAFVHLPIALTPAAGAVLLAFAATRLKARALGLVAIGLLLVASVGAGLSAGAGEEAIDHVERVVPPPTSDELAALRRHESLGEGGWMWPLAAAVLCLPSLVRTEKRRWIPWAGVALGIAGSTVATGWALRTAHSGGEIVYLHGLGVPDRTPAAAPDLPASPASVRTPDDATAED